MVVDEKGYNLIKQFEGLRLTAYRCPAGKWTIGYGHTKGVKKGMYISEEVATHFLIEDVQRVEPVINSYDDIYHWTQNEFDALASFAFNCGIGNLKKLLKYGQRTKSQIADAILLYNKANGRVLRGLIRRRKAERELFVKG
jgi:GH24 family phage-related lysozyme (muramidase)